MKKPDTLEFDWPETGRLEILMRGSHSAVLRYAPSKAVIEEALQKAAQGSARGGEPQVSPTPPNSKVISCGGYYDFTASPDFTITTEQDIITKDGLSTTGSRLSTTGRNPLCR